MKKSLKICFSFFAAGCGLLLLILFGAGIYLNTDHAGRFVCRRIINPAIPGALSWSDHRISIIDGKAVFDGLLLKGPDGDDIIRMDRLQLTISRSGNDAANPADSGLWPYVPALNIDVAGSNLSYQDLQLGSLASDARLASGTLSIDRCALKNKQSALNLSGVVHIADPATYQFLDTPRYDVTLYDTTLRLEDFTRTMTGAISLAGSLAGDVAHPSGTLTLEGREIDTGVQKLKTLVLDTRIHDHRVVIQQGRADIAPNETLRAGGWVAFDGHYDLRLETDGLALDHIDYLRDPAWGDAVLAFGFAGAGHVSNPALSGEIELRGLAVRENIIEPVVLQVDVADMTARLSGKKPADVSATVQLETGDVSGRASFDGIDLEPLFRMAGVDDLQGALSTDIELGGRLDAPEHIRARADIRHLETFWKQEALLTASDQVLVLDNGTFALSGIRLAFFSDGYLDLNGEITLDGRLDMTADGMLPLTIAEPFYEHIYDVDGQVRVSGSVRGPAARPAVAADIRLEGISLNTPYLTQRLRDATGHIHLTPEQAVVEQITGRFDTGGTFKIDGIVHLDQSAPLPSELHLTARSVPMHVPDAMDITLNADLALTGGIDKSSVTGNLVIVEGVYFRDVDLNLLGLVPERSRSETAITRKTTPALLQNMSFDVAVGYRSPFVVENNIAILELKPDLSIRGTPDRMLLSGRAGAEPGGILKYKDREFEVTRGIIDFLNPYKIEPTIDLEGKTVVREWTLFLHVAGTPDDLSFTLTSDPPEDNNDILYLLAFGKTVEEAGDETGGKTASPAKLLADMMAEKLQKNIKDTTGLDTVTIEYTTADTDREADRVKVMVGKDLSRRLSIKYGAETREGEIVRRTITEYKFLENLLMGAYHDSEGDYGGELKYRLEFR